MVIEMGLIYYINNKLGDDLADELHSVFVVLWVALAILIYIWYGIIYWAEYNLPIYVVINSFHLEIVFFILFVIFYVLSLIIG